MQNFSRALFENESNQVLNGLQGFKKGRLRKTKTRVKKWKPTAEEVKQNKEDSRNGIVDIGQRELEKGGPTDVEVEAAAAAARVASMEATFANLQLDSKAESASQDCSRLQAPLTATHGRLGEKGWTAPRLVVDSNAIARPGYDDRTTKSEYLDEPDVLRQKIQVLAGLVRKSKQMCVYSGAGISTASGINDYASSDGKTLSASAPKVKSLFDAKPTISHHVISGLVKQGVVKQWVQQNHDGLPQKAGCPQECLNEIHGAWYDPSNPVVPMDGELRNDLFSRLLLWEKKNDLLLVVGTSLSGMNADRMVVTAGKKMKKKTSSGAVIISLQRTQRDASCALRLFCTIDKALSMLAAELDTPVSFGPSAPLSTLDAKLMPMPHYYLSVYGADGKKMAADSTRRPLDLRDDKKVVITCGPFAGDVGVVMGLHSEGHYRILFKHIDPETGQHVAMTRVLGMWWAADACLGTVQALPIASQ